MLWLYFSHDWSKQWFTELEKWANFCYDLKIHWFNPFTDSLNEKWVNLGHDLGQRFTDLLKNKWKNLSWPKGSIIQTLIRWKGDEWILWFIVSKIHCASNCKKDAIHGLRKYLTLRNWLNDWLIQTPTRWTQEEWIMTKRIHWVKRCSSHGFRFDISRCLKNTDG